MDETAGSVRLDRWLWATRHFKTRALAAKAIDGGRVEVNDGKVKPSRAVRVGDRIRVRIGPFEHRLTVRALAVRRGGAHVAAALYEEDAEGRLIRERIVEQQRLAARLAGSGRQERPSKRDRRELGRLKGKE